MCLAKLSKTSITSLLLFDIGKTLMSFSILSWHHCCSNRLYVCFAENCLYAYENRSDPRIYFGKISCFLYNPVVTLHLPHHVIATFAPNTLFFSNNVTWDHSHACTNHAIHIIQAAHHHTIAIRIMIQKEIKMLHHTATQKTQTSLMLLPT